MTTQPASDAAASVADPADAVAPTRPPHIRGLEWKLTQVLCRVATTLAFDMQVSGIDHVPATGGVLMISNHQSYLDPVLLAVRLKRPMSYMAKAELFKHPAFAWVIRGLNAFPIRQGRGDKGAIEETVKRLRDGFLLNVFPEGHRTEDGEIQPMQRGVALVVRRAEVPIVPAVIEGSFHSWPRGRKIPKAVPIRIAYGPPMNPVGMRPDAIVQWMDTTLRTMQAELRAKMRAEGVLR